LFRERHGEDLPKAENPEDPVFILYQRFKEDTVREMLDNIHSLIKGKSSELAISTYTDYKVDIIKKESNTEIHRPLPVWEYSSSENHQSVEGTWDDKLISNVCINATSINYRFQGVHSPHVAIRLCEALSAGSGLDFCIIGAFDDYPDRKSFSVVKDIYKFHKDHEAYFGNFNVVPDVLLIKPGLHPTEIQLKEYQGLFKMLKEAHIQFQVVEQYALKAKHVKNPQVQLILCADLNPTEPLLEILEGASANKKPLVWIGTSWGRNCYSGFMRLFSIMEAGESSNEKYAYLLNKPGELFNSLKETDWTLFDGPQIPIKGSGDCFYGLEKISLGFFGPPEMCGGNNPTGDYALLGNNVKQTMLFPFQPGWLYMRYGYDEYRHIVIDSLINKGWLKPSLLIEAHPMVEVFLNRYQQVYSAGVHEDRGSPPDNKAALYNLQLINLSGYNGVSFHEPLPVRDIPVTINLAAGEIPSEVLSLTNGRYPPPGPGMAGVSFRKLSFRFDRQGLCFSVPLLEKYEMIIIK
jgi:hypothetical protein